MVKALSISEILQVCSGRLLGAAGTGLFSAIAIDSRQIARPADTLFVALSGAKVKGETFIPDLIQLGVKGFIVPNDYKAELVEDDLSLVAVEDTREALQKLAAYQRSFFQKPVVAITGSNAKTIVKEWLAQVLSEDFSVGKSPKSYNSQVGVPLSVFGLSDYHQLAILEAGISKSGEMKALEQIIQPDLGIFTNIGTAHDEGFSSREEKIQEKLSLFKKTKLLIYQKDDSLLARQIEGHFEPERLVSWSDQPGSDYVRSLKINTESTRIILMKNDLSIHTFQVPFADRASLENITHVLVAALTLEQEFSKIQKAVALLKPLEMRLTLKDGVNDCLLIDDTYSNDLEGLKVALDFMNLQRPKRRKMVILSDLLQQGAAQEVYAEVSHLLQQHGIDRVYGVGKEVGKIRLKDESELIFFDSTEDLLSHLQVSDFQNDLVLITGARIFGFERVVDFLERRIHGTTLEINLNALTHNFNFYKRQLHPKTKVMVMVKAFAYGGGASEIANHLQSLGADYLAVAFTDEGVALRNEGIRLPIMVLNPVKESLSLCEHYDLEPVVFSLSFFRHVADFAKGMARSFPIHLDFDTGMHRLGFAEEEMEDLIELIHSSSHLEIRSIYTHLAGADEEIHRDYSIQQLETFVRMRDQLLASLPYEPQAHALNSAGILAFPNYQFDMVRLGIGLYGVEVTGRHSDALRPISTLKTTISQIKTIPPGGTVGYSRKGVLPQGGRIGTLAIGYADGYDRRFSQGKGYVLVRGKKAKILGNVCMDMCMVDLSELPNAQEGDEVIVFGPEISLSELAREIDTIPYELLTNISTRVKRVYYLD
ncbi:bifunctional UDP-N-acetylmuramoyl-tripeptide:D-alanyl-D-alanine ligase/alanine racemase [Algoriphagus namhaensis]